MLPPSDVLQSESARRAGDGTAEQVPTELHVRKSVLAGNGIGNVAHGIRHSVLLHRRVDAAWWPHIRPVCRHRVGILPWMGTCLLAWS